MQTAETEDTARAAEEAEGEGEGAGEGEREEGEGEGEGEGLDGGDESMEETEASVAAVFLAEGSLEEDDEEEEGVEERERRMEEADRSAFLSAFLLLAREEAESTSISSELSLLERLPFPPFGLLESDSPSVLVSASVSRLESALLGRGAAFHTHRHKQTDTYRHSDT